MTPDQKVKAAEAALRKAQDEAKQAKLEQLALAADKKLAEAARAVWDIADAADHPEWLHDMEKQVHLVRDRIALSLLGAGPRVEGLEKLDPHRWGPGEFATNEPHTYTTDEDVHHAIATWIFDTLGVRGYERGRQEKWEEQWSKEEMDGHEEALARIRELIFNAFKAAYGNESRAREFANESTRAWREGRHDT